MRTAGSEGRIQVAVWLLISPLQAAAYELPGLPCRHCGRMQEERGRDADQNCSPHIFARYASSHAARAQ